MKILTILLPIKLVKLNGSEKTGYLIGITESICLI